MLNERDPRSELRWTLTSDGHGPLAADRPHTVIRFAARADKAHEGPMVHLESDSKDGDATVVLPDGLELAHTPDGRLAYFAFDGPIGDSLRTYGEWAGAEIEFLKQFVTEGACVVDGGANIGTHTLPLARLCGPDGRVVAIEASPELAHVLETNVRLNGLTNVDVVTAALDRDAGTAYVSQLDPGRRQNTGVIRAAPVTGGEFKLAIRRVRLDDLDLKRLDFLKLDVEGAEAAAIEGGMRTIQEHRPVILAEVLGIDVGVKLIQALTQLAYKVFFCSFAAFNPDNHHGVAENLFGVAREAALLFIPDAMRLPHANAATELSSILHLEDFVRSLSTMPQYGDESGDDRKIEHLWSQRASMRNELSAAKSALASDTVDKEAGLNLVLDRQRHLEADLDVLRSEIAILKTKDSERDTAWRNQEQAFAKARSEDQDVIARMKAEITDLRAAMIGNAEDRGAAVLEIETLREDVALLQVLSSQVEILQDQFAALQEETLKGLSNEIAVLKEQHDDQARREQADDLNQGNRRFRFLTKRQ